MGLQRFGNGPNKRHADLHGLTCDVCFRPFQTIHQTTPTCSSKCGAVRARLLRKYGVMPDEWQAILEAQGYACACCGLNLIGTRPHTDHDHESTLVRGILCCNCNTGIGKVGDQPADLDRVQRYLMRHRDLLGELLAA